MYLIKTALEGTQFTIKFIENQPNKAPVGIALENTVIKGNDAKILTRFPIGTHFIITDIQWGEMESRLQGSVRPMFYDDMIYAGMTASENTPTTGDVDYMIDWMISNTEYGCDGARKYAAKFVELGYHVDVENKCKAYTEDTSGTLRERIIRQYPCPKESEIGFHVDEDVWYLLIRNIMRGENTMLIGPTGSGKTELVTHITKAMDKHLSIQDMGTVQDAQSALLGVHRLNKEGHSEFDYAPFVGHVQREGIVLLDELNRAPLSAANILFPCLDRRRYLPIDIAVGEGVRTVPVHDNCVFFATANLGAEYTGTTQIDRALLDRFMPVELSYPSEDAEAKILVIRTGIDNKTAKAIVKVSKTIREQFRDQELSNVVSVRHTLLAASLIKDGFDTVGALMKVIMPLFDDSTGVSERTKVKSIIAAN
jgi:nitric oxide reductase NorQ protein